MENDNKGQDGPVPERYMAALRLEPGTPFVPASNGPIAEMVPMTLVLLPEGTKDNKPSFVIILKHPANPLMVLGQVSLRTLASVLDDLGYTLTEKK